jgi:hypothetical protein
VSCLTAQSWASARRGSVAFPALRERSD